MKKALSLTLALVLCLSLCACSGGNSNETELTSENCTTYLNISAYPSFTGKAWPMKPSGASNSIQCNSKAECKVSISAASPNYDFVNTVITIKVSGTYDTFRGFEKTEDVAFSEEITITCNIGGGGSGRVVVFEGIDTKYQIIDNSIEYEYEVISISGTVARVG